MEEEPRYFIVTTTMYAYASATGRGAFQLAPAQVYEATQVGKSHVVLDHPQRPGRYTCRSSPPGGGPA
jgi:hypothetical protein